MPRTLIDIALGVLLGIGLLVFIRDKPIEDINPAAALRALNDQNSHKAYEQTNRMAGLFVLDMDANGPDIMDHIANRWRSETFVFYDFDGDGIDNRTSWIYPAEYILVRDLNANGKIDTLAEMFADPKNDGLAALKALDENNDGAITPADPGFAALLVWRDVTMDAASNAGELQSLADAGFTNIRLAPPTEQHAKQHAAQRYVHKIARADGAGRKAVDLYQVFLDYHTRLTRETTTDDWMLGTVEGDTGYFANAPTLRGQGRLRRLFEAMRTSSDVYTAVGIVQSIHPGNYRDFMRAVQNLMFIWAGTLNTPVGARGPYVDARKLETVEKFIGTPLTFAPHASPNPNKFNKNMAMGLWWRAYKGVACPFFFHSLDMGRNYASQIIYIVALRNGMAKKMLNEVFEGQGLSDRQMNIQLSDIRKDDKKLIRALRPRAGNGGDIRAGYHAFAMKCLNQIRIAYTLTRVAPENHPDGESWETAMEGILHDAGSSYPLAALNDYLYYLDPLDAPEPEAGFIERFAYFAQSDNGRIFQTYLAIGAALALFFILRALGNKYIARAGAQDKTTS